MLELIQHAKLALITGVAGQSTGIAVPDRCSAAVIEFLNDLNGS